MSYLSEINKLRQVFPEDTLDLQSNYVGVKESNKLTEEKIIELVTLAKFCPLVSSKKIEGHFVFTVVPYKVPSFFTTRGCDKLLKSDYFKLDEITSLLEKSLFIDKEESMPDDKWSSINSFRKIILPALNKGVSTLISKYDSKNLIVEIGSGIGYFLPEDLSPRIIRIQPSKTECLLLSKANSNPIYQMNIEQLYETLKGKKKIPLFFALNVFDTMSREIRKSSFSQLSELQNPGDHILIMLDTNPELKIVLSELKKLYSDHAIFPYIPLGSQSRLSFIIVPLEFAPFDPSYEKFLSMINLECSLFSGGLLSLIQTELHTLQKDLNLKVITLDDFFSYQIKEELEEVGYKANIYYHASFARGPLPKDLPNIKQDLLYKAVADTGTVRQWAVNDQNLINSLQQKDLILPTDIDGIPLGNLKKDEKIFGAELLVVEAKKIN
jgi:hypothetical protein